MANEKTQSFYEVLGVDKTADERSIKKAYFTLVRKYPPETHPEEFKKIREAYEVLSNPVSRKDYDALDTRVLVAMADCLSGQKQYEAALAELDKAINMDGQVDFQDFVFFMRKVQIQLLRNRADLAETDLDQIFKILPDDPDTRKYVATRLASLAADLFAMKRSVDANRLLQRCRQLDPSRASMSFQFPSRTTVPIATLPPTSQDWIANHGKEWAAGKLQHGKWGGPIFLLIVAAFTGLGVFANAFGATRLWDHSQQLW